MSNVQIGSNVWINRDSPEGRENNYHAASKHLPGDLAMKLITGTLERRIINQCLLDGRLTRRQYEEYKTWKFFLPHNHEDDPSVRPKLSAPEATNAQESR